MMSKTVSELRPGQFFEFIQPGYCFNRCMWIGIDEEGIIRFVYQSAGLNFFVLSSIDIKNTNQKVTTDVPQVWRVLREAEKKDE